MPAGGERQAAAGGEVHVGKLTNDEARRCRPDGFLNRPERVRKLARRDMEQVIPFAPQTPQSGLKKMTMIGEEAGLADPDGCASPWRGGTKCKPCQGRHVPEIFFADFMYARTAQTKRETGRLARLGSLPEPKDAGGLESGC